tara:strand:- start:2639 stop:2842 length:204 start_codon:yes stop_codon:yes gene_type:complete
LSDFSISCQKAGICAVARRKLEGKFGFDTGASKAHMIGISPRQLNALLAPEIAAASNGVQRAEKPKI